MFKFLKRKPRNENSPAYRREKAAAVSGKHIRYVAERINNEEIIVGKEGSLTLRGDECIVFASGNIVFRADVTDLTISELMSGNGVILTAHDIESGGALRSVVAHYTYYNK